MIFDHMNLERLRVKLNDTKQYPENELTCNFTPEQMDYSRVYTSFLAAGLKTHDVDTGTVVSYTDFARVYPIFHIDVSRRDMQVYETQMTTSINVQYKLRTAPTSNYHVYCIVMFERRWSSPQFVLYIDSSCHLRFGPSTPIRKMDCTPG
jgi:hypothetical protein